MESTYAENGSSRFRSADVFLTTPSSPTAIIPAPAIPESSESVFSMTSGDVPAGSPIDSTVYLSMG